MYNDIPKSYKISTKKIDKSLTYNKYSKAEVLKDLEKNLFSKSIEKTIFWGCELIISEYIDILYERLFQFFIMDINISNIQLIDLFYEEFQHYDKYKSQKKNDLTDIMNNQFFRNHTASIICYLTFSSKSKLPTLPKIKPEELIIKKSKLLSTNLDRIKKYITKEDHKDIIIPLSEILTNLHIKKLRKSVDNCMFWLSWLLTYEKKYHKNNLICHYTTNVSELSEKLKNDFTWILWTILLDISDNKYVLLLYKLYVRGFNKSKKVKRIYLIVLAFILVINPLPEINYNVPILLDKYSSIKNKVIACINFQYKDLLLNKESQKNIYPSITKENSPLFSKEVFSNINIDKYI